jgi:steroid delta-isomerase-like uncharacterized protein
VKPGGEARVGATENLDLHARWAKAENEHDLTHHGEFLHSDIVVVAPGGARYEGLAAYITMMEESYAGLDDFHTDIDDRFATDDRVVCRWRTSGTHRNDHFSIPTTGKHIEFPGVSLWEFDDGKARSGYVFPDVASIMTQLMS